MINLIVEAMQKAIYAVTHDEDLDFAFHWGEAGGIAAVAGVFGVKALEMCDDISDAYEDVDLDFMKYILREASERLDNGDEHYARTRDNMLHALEFGNCSRLRGQVGLQSKFRAWLPLCERPDGP